MTMKGTTELQATHIERVCKLAKELTKIDAFYEIEINARTMVEYNRCKERWDAFVEHDMYLTYLGVIVYKPEN
jgi:hypothetical protein